MRSSSFERKGLIRPLRLLTKKLNDNLEKVNIALNKGIRDSQIYQASEAAIHLSTLEIGRLSSDF
jgi:hypothetical protein